MWIFVWKLNVVIFILLNPKPPEPLLTKLKPNLFKSKYRNSNFYIANTPHFSPHPKPKSVKIC